MEIVTVWVIRCLCGDSYIAGLVDGDEKSELMCLNCGAKLIRNGDSCLAEVDTDTYDLASKPYREPGIYKFGMSVVEAEDGA